MARRITGAAFLSLDGVMQAPGGPTEDPTGGFDQGGWVFKLWDEGIDETLGALFTPPYDLLLGRRTYDIFAAYWPYADGDNKPMGEAFDAANKYVLTRGDQPLEWQNSHRMRGVEDISALKQTEGADLVIQGSSQIYPALLAAGLIDQLITMTYPVILGRGKRLFGEGTLVDKLEMTDHRVTAKGTVVATYTPGGTLPPYPDEAPIPITSDRELERRRRMEEGTW
ncbi:dihydrofolate reductase family protein [Alteriqipengyuania lutimaris]|uniref:Dihydrofolate reductase n=1 Tax=Alteriqipengyuania lutimaris TaxID=1538146 RepID=A0A395LL14_9SPHN|nr:dihydrofolate reductase family protein [Alteriqipengyuania lutimaris]MBB3033227.1 dihydrofolate reductase [Alteriqipengyuania lutimaris]RDS77726.1 dihydrofolate reductase [Alteriqipengyuania lutimaris]